MTPVFIDIASWCEICPLVAREVAAVAIGWQDGEDDFTVEVVVPSDVCEKLRECGYDTSGCTVSDRPMHKVSRTITSLGGVNPFGDPATDLRLVGWDINSKVWPLLDANMMREGCSLYRFRCSIWKKWNDNRFGDLRNLLTQGYYCAKDDDMPFEDFVEVITGNKVPVFDGTMVAGLSRGSLEKAMADRILAMVDLYNKYGGQNG